MKKTRIAGIAVIILTAFLFVFNSCKKDFETINQDPNNAGLDKASPDMLLTGAIESMTDRVHETFLGEEMGNCWAQHEAKVQYTDEDRYIYRVSVVNNTWASFYAANGMDVATLYNVAVEEKLPNYQGVAIVLKCYIVSVLTDLFGPVPYTEAWTDNTLPAYDSQETIYRDIIAQLEVANNLLDPAGTEINGDILYGNDISKWKKFANSLKMRLLLRMSAKDEPFATTELTKIVSDPTTYPVFGSNADNAALQYLGSAPNNNPMNENRKTRDDHRISKTLVDIMWTNSPNLDYRICIYANQDDNNTFEGMPNGLTSSQAASYNGNGIKYTSKVGTWFTGVHDDGLTAPGMLMSYSELQFILAEAAFKGYIPGGTTEAGNYYNAGIYASYNQYGANLVAAVDNYGYLPDADATADSLAADYIANDNYGWNAVNGMELIATQRWLASFDQGLQSWFEWRRTGFPVLTPAAEGMNNGLIPVRVPYPTDEAARNPSSLAAGIGLLGGADDMNTRVWWDVTP